jgi:hypothetical protein
MKSLLDVDRLETLGFFAHVDPADLPHTRARARQSGNPFAGADRRLYTADAENLAEHGVRDFLGSVAPYLRRQRVAIDVTYRAVKVPARGGRPAGIARATLDANGWIDADGAAPYVESMRIALRPGEAMRVVTEDTWQQAARYSLFFGDREVVVYRCENDETWDGWEQATASTLSLLDELLEAHASRDRAFAMMEGNDLQIALVTPEMAEVINAACPPRQRLIRAAP